ncbi:hypothetical protein ALQ17_01706 [Pseudomonas fluorescens]|nr:hypothetical protein ALQ17_01706 [Pseudomonas fluorescens]
MAMINTPYGQPTQTYYPHSYPSDGGARCGNQPAMSNSLELSRPVADSLVARDFVDAFPYFQGESGFVTRETLEHAANRPLSGDPFHDQMSMLAREVLSRPGMSNLLDGINHGGHEDGLISLGDAQEAVCEYEAQEAAYMQGGPVGYHGGMRGGPAGNYYGDMQNPSGRYSGGMQRSGFESGYGDNGARNYHPAGSGMSPQNAEVANNFKYAKDSDIATELGNNVDYFKPNQDGKITQQSLREVANRPLTGNPVDDRMSLLAKEIISRPALNRKLDSDHDADKPDGLIGRDTIDRVSRQSAEPDYATLSDVELLQALKDKFKQYWSKDDYISFDSLKEAAAASPPTDKSRLAAEFLRRPGLLKEVDVGTDGKGGRGAEDERFDRLNVDHVIKEKQASQLLG